MEAAHRGGMLSITVSDDGKGIEPEYLPHIFDFGFTTSRHGSGLGLFHVYELMKKMKGDIRVNTDDPIPGAKGAEFLLTFSK